MIAVVLVLGPTSDQKPLSGEFAKTGLSQFLELWRTPPLTIGIVLSEMVAKDDRRPQVRTELRERH
jgi:hypothetical protein